MSIRAIVRTDRPSGEDIRTAVACAAVALFVGLVGMSSILAVNGGDITTLVRMAESDGMSRLARRIDPGFSMGPPAVHYDGVYYYAIAIDPLALGEAHELIDLAAHRYGHPAYGWMAWVASAGHPEWVPAALAALSLLGLIGGAFFTSLLARDLGASSWMGLGIAFNPGLVFAATADLSEAVSAAVLAAALWLWFRGRKRSSAVLLVLLCFLKFQLLLIPVALGLFEIVRYLRGERAHKIWPSLAILAVGPVLFGGWQIYVFSRLGEWPIFLGPELLTVPPFGFLSTIGTLGNIKQFLSSQSQLVAGMLPIVVCVMAVFLVGVVRSVRMRHEFDAMFLFQGLMVLALNDWNLFFPKELIRVTAIPLLLLFPVLSSRFATTEPTT